MRTIWWSTLCIPASFRKARLSTFRMKCSGGRKHRLENSWLDAVRLGHSRTSNEVLICTQEGELSVYKMSDKKELIITFKGLTRGISAIGRHPKISSLFLTASLEGVIKFWCLDVSFRFAETLLLEIHWRVHILTEGIDQQDKVMGQEFCLCLGWLDLNRRNSWHHLDVP